MALLLIFDHDVTDPDPSRDYAAPKKGYVIDVYESSEPYVGNPDPPFVILNISDRTKAEVEQYIQGWRRKVDYNIIARDISLDGWRLDLFTTNLNASGVGHVPLAKVQTYLENWGAQNINVVNNAVRFDITVSAALRSKNFWDVDTQLIVFNEIAYDEEEGVHRTQADYSATSFPEEKVSMKVKERKGYVVSNTGGVVIFDIRRNSVIDKVRGDVKRLVSNKIAYRRYYIDPIVVDQIIANGRSMTTTASVVAPYIRDRMTE
jgi:hypothetical protein